MSERAASDPRRRPSWRRLAPLMLLAVLGVAMFLPTPAMLRGEAGDSPAVDRLMRVIDGLPEEPIVLVAFDPDIGTYPEIRPVVRTLLAQLLARPALVAMVSYTAEGRALALAELGRLYEVQPRQIRLLDLGFIPGAEAALVASVSAVVPTGASGRLADELRARDAGMGIGAFDAALVVSGNDLGPRSWVEQVRTRAAGVPLIAVAPTFQQPELAPYLASGQLAALIGTPADAAAYLDRAAPERPELVGDAPPGPLPILLGMLLAIGVLLHAAGSRLAAGLRGLLAGRDGA